MKKILIDFEKSLDPFSGLGQFCYFLKSEFDQINKNVEIDYFIPKNKKITKFLPFLVPKSDVFHGIHQDSPYIPWDKKTKYVLTIHDFNAIYENNSENFKTNYLNKLQNKINRAAQITFISEFTKSEASKFLNLDNKKTTIIYNGISLPDEVMIPKNIPKNKFLFTIGTVLPKKNFHVLIDMMNFLPDFELVIAGTLFHKYAKEMINELENKTIKNRIHFVETISNEEKKWYYQNCTAFVFPSLLEGFGLPIAEAQSFGLPLFLSNKTSIPEIGSADAFYFNNFNAEDMANLIINSLENFDERTKNNLIEHSKKFNWKTSAKKYLEIYTSL